MREGVVNITIFCCIAEHVYEWQRRARVQNFQETNSLSEDSDLELQSTMDFRWRSEDTARDSGCTIQRLEKDKQSLTLQVSVLSDQVEAQSEKIRELEYYNNERRLRLQAAEEMLESVGENYLILSLKK